MKSLFGFKVGSTRVVPIVSKIIAVFIVAMLVSNLASNYFNLSFNKNVLLKLAQKLLLKDLSEFYNIAGNQYEVVEASKVNAMLAFTVEEEERMIRDAEKKAKDVIIQGALQNLSGKKSVALGVQENGQIIFQASHEGVPNKKIFTDTAVLKSMIDGKEGVIKFKFGAMNYFGMYKFDPRWNIYLIRAEEIDEFYSETNRIFVVVSVIILIFTVIATCIGIIVIGRILRFIGIFTKQLKIMNEKQKMGFLDLKGAPSDDVTLLGVTFNAFSSTISNLIEIFRRFVSKDMAIKAYKERAVHLDGEQKELTMLFSDIKSFTFITETLGNDIIKLLNVHYDGAIEQITKRNGIIGSIIGDAILAVYGTMEDMPRNVNKSYEAIKSAYGIQDVDAELRDIMRKRRDELLKIKKTLTEAEENVYKAVLLEVGVGIDGGTVFYGNIGSYERMTNTVIGDSVNSAARLEGLTRLYKVPVIVSEYIKNDVISNIDKYEIDYEFVELDTAQVKGKTIGKKIFYPVPKKIYIENRKMFEYFSVGLSAYYGGSWAKAKNAFALCKSLPMTRVFLDRIGDSYKAPEGWNSIWIMKEK